LQIFGGAFGSPGRFSEGWWIPTRNRCALFIRRTGFLDAKVEQQTEDNYKGKEGDLFIRFVVQEGKQTRVASLSIEGNHAFKEAELLDVIGSTPGQPYSDFGVTTDRDNILALYFNEGFPRRAFRQRRNASPPVRRHRKRTPEGARLLRRTKQKRAEGRGFKPAIEQADAVRLVYRIVEGPQTLVRRILIGGYEHTRTGVIQQTSPSRVRLMRTSSTCDHSRSRVLVAAD